MPDQYRSIFGGGDNVGDGGTASGKKIKKISSSTGLPPRVSDGTSPQGPGSGYSPGGYDINPLDPIGTGTGVIKESEDLITGIRAALFGSDIPDYAGQRGGLLGDLPVIGEGGRIATGALAGVARPVLGAVGEVGSAALNAAGGAMEHLDLGSDEDHAKLQEDFDAVPADFVGKAAALEQIAKDPGATGHYMAKVVNEYRRERMLQGDLMGDKPSLYGDVYKQAGSAAEGLDNLLGFFTNLARPGIRHLTGQDARIEAILAVGDGLDFAAGGMRPDEGILGTGLLANPEFGTALTDAEQIVYKKVKSGDWTRDEAHDFLIMSGQGFRSFAANIASEVALDPTVVASLGSVAVAKFGATGAKLTANLLKAEKLLKESQSLHRAAEVAGHADEAAKLAKEVEAAEKAYQAAKGALKQDELTGLSRLNPVAQAAHNDTLAGIARRMYTAYDVLQDAHVTKAMYYARGIIDPLAVITLKNPFKRQMLHLLSDDAARITIGAFGNGNHAAVLHDLADIEGAPQLVEMFTQDLGDYSGNIFRRVIARAERLAALTNGRAADLMKKNVTEHLADLGDTIRTGSHEEGVLLEANRFRKPIGEWDDAAYKNLAKRMEDNYGYKTAEEWEKWLRRGSMNADRLSMLHAATYARAWRRLRTAIEQAIERGEDANLLNGKLSRLILINRRTLTQQGAEGIIEKVKKLKTVQAKIKHIEKMQELYPELRGFSLDMKKKVASIERFLDDLERNKLGLPSQLLDDELSTLPDDLRGLHDDVFTLGVAPEDQYKWGLRRSNATGGELAPTHDVWVDHVVSDMNRGFQPIGTRIEQNLLGQPIPGAAKKLLRATDHIDAGARTMARRITGQVIVETARLQFVSDAKSRYGHVGVTDKIANDIMDALDQAVANQDLVVRPVGFTGGTIWDIASSVLPKNIDRAKFGRREVIDLLWRAYEGDLRYVGVTQKLSNRIKRMLAFEGNTAAFLAEGAYPFLKFRINMAFQFQEKIEPWLLSSLRGITPAGSFRKLNDADKITYQLLDKMAQRSLVSSADHEMAEQAGKILHGKNIDDMARASDTALGKMTQRLGVDWEAIRDVKGLKQVHLLRTFRKGLGKELRRSWDEIEPGLWDDMYQTAVARYGKGASALSEDDFAVMLMTEQIMGSDLKFAGAIEGRMQKLANQFGHVDYRAAMEPGKWAAPQYVGEMQALNMDDVAHLIAFEGIRPGTVTKNLGDLQAVIAAGKYSIDDVLDALRHFNADPDFLMRVRANLEFSYEGFWRQVGKDFNLDAEGIAKYQGVIDRIAALRGMKPAEYLSQMLVPTIGRGKQDAVVGHLGKLIQVFDSEGDVLAEQADLGQLFVRAAGEGTEDDFVRQLSSIYAAHLDPSAKLRIIEAFNPEVKARIAEMEDISLERVEEAFWTPDIQEQFQRMILGEVNVPDTNLGDLWEAGKLRTVEEWDRVDPARDIVVRREDGQIIRMPPKSTLVGPGLRAAGPNVKKTILRTIGDLRAIAPDMPIRQIDVLDTPMFQKFLLDSEDAEGIAAGVFHTDDGGVVVYMNKKFFGDDMDDWFAGEADYQLRAQSQLKFKNSNGIEVDRESVLGARESVAENAVETVQHELGHVLHEQVRLRLGELMKAGKGKTKEARALKKIMKWQEKFEGSLARVRLSEYANTREVEGMAEIISLIIMGKDPKLIDEATAPGVANFLRGVGEQAPAKPMILPKRVEITDADSYDQYLVYLEQLRPDHPDLSGMKNLLSKMDDAELDGYDDELQDLLSEAQAAIDNISEGESAFRDLDNLINIMTGEEDIPKSGLINRSIEELTKGPQSVEEAVNELRQLMMDAKVLREPPVNHADAIPQNPELIRYTNWFGQWTNAAFGEFFKHGASASQANVLGKIAGIPTTDASPFDMTQQLLMSTAIENMKAKFDDAWRLQYYARGRSMLERSVNHPLFGIYPASYMWGKMLPEMIRFIAQEPFGLRTGAAAYSTMDVMAAVATQRELDPGMDEQIEKLGHNPAIFGLGYMVPSWPWEINASWPGYVREFGKEGNDLIDRIEGGGLAATPAASSGINMPEVVSKVTDLMDPSLGPQRMWGEPLEELNPPNLDPVPATVTSGPVPATELGDPLQDALNDLRSLFGG